MLAEYPSNSGLSRSNGSPLLIRVVRHVLLVGRSAMPGGGAIGPFSIVKPEYAFVPGRVGPGSPNVEKAFVPGRVGPGSPNSENALVAGRDGPGSPSCEKAWVPGREGPGSPSSSEQASREALPERTDEAVELERARPASVDELEAGAMVVETGAMAVGW